EPWQRSVVGGSGAGSPVCGSRLRERTSAAGQTPWRIHTRAGRRPGSALTRYLPDCGHIWPKYDPVLSRSGPQLGIAHRGPLPAQLSPASSHFMSVSCPPPSETASGRGVTIIQEEEQ